VEIGASFARYRPRPTRLDLAGISEVPEMRTGHGEAFELFRAHESPFLDEGPDMFRFLHPIVGLSKPLHL
jgi:hypothetical protein